MSKKLPSWLSLELLESKPLEQIASERGVKLQTMERYIRQLVQLGMISKQRAIELLGKTKPAIPPIPSKPPSQLVEFKLHIPSQLLQRFQQVKQILESERGYQMQDREVLEYLITHFDGDTYAIYIPESFKRKKDLYEQKKGVKLTNLEFLKLLLDQLKI